MFGNSLSTITNGVEDLRDNPGYMVQVLVKGGRRIRGPISLE